MVCTDCKQNNQNSSILGWFGMRISDDALENEAEIVISLAHSRQFRLQDL